MGAVYFSFLMDLGREKMWFFSSTGRHSLELNSRLSKGNREVIPECRCWTER